MTPQPMTERFEMRLGQAVIEQVDSWRAQQYDLPSRSEAVRRLIEAGLAANSGKKAITIEGGERLIILMLCDLFKQLKLKGNIEPKFIEETIYGGHFWGLEWQYPGIFHGHEDHQEVVREVVDILDMWSFLEDGFNNLSKKDKERLAKEAEPFGNNVVFRGFDGNNEGEHVGVARYLIDELDRFTKFKGRDLDSHMPTLEPYRRMLKVFDPIRSATMGRNLNVSELVEILNAKIHPSQRKKSSEG